MPIHKTNQKSHFYHPRRTVSEKMPLDSRTVFNLIFILYSRINQPSEIEHVLFEPVRCFNMVL